MSHLAVFREGWNNERLAELALSRICFVSRPTTVADDIGSDFQCTLFEEVGNSKGSRLAPRSPFVVQVKSSGKRVSLTKQIDYLARLEAPFFVAIPDKTRPRLHLYSGRYLPYAFAYRGTSPSSLTAVLTRARRPTIQALRESVSGGPRRVTVSFPRVATLGLRPSNSEALANARTLEEECSEVGLNNYLRLARQYVFTFGSGAVRTVLAGSGSADVFRKNFADRLHEYCRNMEWLLKYRAGTVSMAEVQELLAVVDLIGHRLPRHTAMGRAVRRLRKRVVAGAA